MRNLLSGTPEDIGAQMADLNPTDTLSLLRSYTEALGTKRATSKNGGWTAYYDWLQFAAKLLLQTAESRLPQNAEKEELT